MKRIQCLALILSAALLLCSCSPKKQKDSASDKQDPDAVDTMVDTPDDGEHGSDTQKSPDDAVSDEHNTEGENPSADGNDQTQGKTPADDTPAGTVVTQPNTPVSDPLSGAGVTSTAPKNDYSNMTLETFFQNAAFVGDSVMYGFDLYTGRNQTLEASSTFLTITSFAARHALSDVGPKSYHPSYNGVKMKVEDALALDGAQAAFIFLGLNDVRVTPYTYYDNYIEFMGRIREKNPNIDLFILSTTYPVESPNSMDRQTAASYRDQLQDLNVRLKAWCDEGNGYFINIVSPLLNDQGFLDSNYSSDNYVHLTNSAYAIWAATIENYISTLIETGTAPQETLTEYEFTKDGTPAGTDATAPAETPDNTVTPDENDNTPAQPVPEEPTETPENIENTIPEEV